eukprot:g4230.t1
MTPSKSKVAAAVFVILGMAAVVVMYANTTGTSTAVADAGNLQHGRMALRMDALHRMVGHHSATQQLEHGRHRTAVGEGKDEACATRKGAAQGSEVWCLCNGSRNKVAQRGCTSGNPRSYVCKWDTDKCVPVKAAASQPEEDKAQAEAAAKAKAEAEAKAKAETAAASGKDKVANAVNKIGATTALKEAGEEGKAKRDEAEAAAKAKADAAAASGKDKVANAVAKISATTALKEAGEDGKAKREKAEAAAKAEAEAAAASGKDKLNNAVTKIGAANALNEAGAKADKTYCAHTCTEKRERKDWALMSTKERDTYIKAVKLLYEGGVYTAFVKIHQNGINEPYAHGTSAFLPWHRKYLIEMENALRCLGKEFECVTIPYWDWAEWQYFCNEESKNNGNTQICTSYDMVPPMMKEEMAKARVKLNVDKDIETAKTNVKSILADFGGPATKKENCRAPDCLWGSAGNGDANEVVGCVQNGPFAGWKDWDGHCLSRGIDWKLPATLPGITNRPFTTNDFLLSVIMDNKEYGASWSSGFRGALQGEPHNNQHNYLGGHMRSMRSPMDPIFYTHHSMVEKTWVRWQDCHRYDEVSTEEKSDTHYIGNSEDKNGKVGEDDSIDVPMPFFLASETPFKPDEKKCSASAMGPAGNECTKCLGTNFASSLGSHWCQKAWDPACLDFCAREQCREKCGTGGGHRALKPSDFAHKTLGDKYGYKWDHDELGDKPRDFLKKSTDYGGSGYTYQIDAFDKTIGDKVCKMAYNENKEPGQDSAKPDPAKPDPAKPDSAKPDPAKPDPAKPDPAKPDPAKPDPAKTDPAKTDAPKTDPAKPDPAKPDPAKPDPTKTDPAKPDPTKTDPAKTEAVTALLEAFEGTTHLYKAKKFVQVVKKAIKKEGLDVYEAVKKTADAAATNQCGLQNVSPMCKDIQCAFKCPQTPDAMAAFRPSNDKEKSVLAACKFNMLFGAPKSSDNLRWSTTCKPDDKPAGAKELWGKLKQNLRKAVENIKPAH